MADLDQLSPPWWHHWLPTLGAVFGTVITGIISAVLWLTRDRMYVQSTLEDIISRLERLEDTHERWDDGNVLNDKINDLDKRFSVQLMEAITMLREMQQRLNRENGHRKENGK